MTRMFVAAVPPEGALEHLDEFLSVRREAAAYRWARAEHLHLTLAFTADLPERRLDDAVVRLARGVAKRRPLTLTIAGGGAFPHPDRARVLYAGVRATTDDLTELARLATGARAALGKAGAKVDGQRFRPHLTIARLARPDNVTSWVRLLDAYAGPAWELGEVALMASHLGEGPRRTPRHEVVETFALGR